jgi:hypothetical protein
MHIDHQSAGRAQHDRVLLPQVGSLASDLTSLANVVDRLHTEFAPQLDLGVVVSTFRRLARGPGRPGRTNGPNVIFRRRRIVKPKRGRLHPVLINRGDRYADYLRASVNALTVGFCVVIARL